MTVFRGYIFSVDSLLKSCKDPQNCPKMTEFSKVTFFESANFRELCQKQRNPRKLIASKINNNKVYVGKFVCDKNQSSPILLYTSCGSGTFEKPWITYLRVNGSKPLEIGQFFSESQF